MKKDTKRRLVAYSIAAVVLGGLAYGGFIYKAEPNPQQLFQSAKILLVAGAVDKAIVDAERGLEQVPDDPFGHTVVADCYAMAGRLEDALEHRRRALLLTDAEDQNFGLLSLGYADSLLSVGRNAEAEEEAVQLAASHPQMHGAWIVAGCAREALGRIEEARSAFRTACETETAAPVTFLALARFEERSGERAAGIPPVLEAIGRWPGHPGLSVAGARLLHLERRTQEAIRLLASVPREGKARARRLLASYEDLADLRNEPEVQRIFERQSVAEDPE